MYFMSVEFVWGVILNLYGGVIMIIVVIGILGVGKMIILKFLVEKLGYEYVNLRDYVFEKGIGEMKENEFEIDVDEFREVFGRDFKGKNVVVDGYLSYFFKVDFVIVFRVNLKLIVERLKERGYGREKFGENVEVELVDVIFVEVFEENENVIEVDIIGKMLEEVVEEILNFI